MDKYFVVGVTTIPYLGFGCIITIDSKKERTYLVCIVENSRALALTLQKMLSKVVGKRGLVDIL